MAPSTGRLKYKMSVYGVMCLCVLFQFVPFCRSAGLPSKSANLNVPHAAKKGYVVLRESFIAECTDIIHIQQSKGRALNQPLLTVQNDGSLIVNASLHDFVDDLFVIQSKTSDKCIELAKTSVSLSLPIHAEVVHTQDILSFINCEYSGSLRENSPRGTLVQGISHLYACSVTSCRNNNDYKIQGSNEFYLQTVFVKGHVEVQILSKKVLKHSPKNVHKFTIVAYSSDGHTGYTQIQIHINTKEPIVPFPLSTHHDDILRYVPKINQRHKRDTTTETLIAKNVNETQTGVLFSLESPPNTTWEYGLLRSTYENKFSVSSAGVVSVADGAKLDFEELRDAGESNTVSLTVAVTRKSDNVVVKQLIQPVNILDVNDEDPVFSNEPKPFLATRSANDPTGTIVYTLTAVDPDAGAIVVLEEETSANTAAATYYRVQISGNRAQILTKSVGVPQNSEHRMSVRAIDTAAPTSQRTVAEVLIKAGQRSPQFYQQNYAISFEENNNVDQSITPLPIEVLSFQDNIVQFDILDENNQPSSVFSAQALPSTGSKTKRCKILVKQVIDYERDAQEYDLTITARETSTGLISSSKVIIKVTDINEFIPEFTYSSYKRNEAIPETMAVGSSLLTVSASDGDLNSKLTFSVDDDHFEAVSLNPNSENRFSSAVIKIKKHLDYDAINPKVYSFQVFAVDDGKIKKTGESTIQIVVTNVNDEAPKISPNLTADVRYNAEVGTNVVLVQATDGDGDIITYSFVANYPKFDLDRTSGRITIADVIASNQESIRDFRYELQVRAVDDGSCCTEPGTLHSSTGTVTVNILTDNIHRPAFTKCTEYRPSVVEEAEDAFVIQVHAVDEDYGKNGDVTYYIIDANSLFRINETSGQLYTKTKIDREALNATTTVPVNVGARDGGNLTSTCSLLVGILDINDNAPVFVKSGPYTEKILKNTSPGLGAVEVAATDKDILNNAEITYELVENPGGYFKFDSQSKFTGEIKVNKSLTTAPLSINLKVRASDNGDVPKSTNVSFTIELVEDSSQLPPSWPGPEQAYEITLNESQPVGELFLPFQAKSYVDGNDQLSYKVVEDSAFQAVLNITDQKGKLRLTSPLDYETTTVHMVTLRATDVNDNSKNRRVTININDANDESPLFLGLNNGWLVLALLEGNYRSASPSKFIARIQSTDLDGTSPNNKTTNYRIVSGGDVGNFSIDPITGDLTTKGDFDREQKDLYTLAVAVDDGAPSSLHRPPDGLPNTAQVSVKLEIGDINDNTPYFPAPYNINVTEDTLLGSVVVRVKAEDRDSAAILVYTITEPIPVDNAFILDATTGDLKVAKNLDYDKGKKVYTFNITVNDRKFSNTTKVTVNVLDVNDNMPIVKDYFFPNFTENSTSVIGPIATITADDIDNNGVNTFYYELSFPNPSYGEIFMINRKTGVLSIKKKLDRDFPNGKATYQFSVKVADENPETGNPRYGTGGITVSPIDINDNPPVLVDKDMIVLENQPAGKLVGRLSIVDYDAGDNAKFSVRLVSQTDEKGAVVDVFNLSTSSLDLYTTAEFDRENISMYYLLLEAKDMGEPSLTGTGSLTVYIGDENDNSPFFTQNFTCILPESQTSGEFCRIKANDLDVGINARLTYYLNDEGTVLQYFKMDQDTETNEGVIVIFRPADYDNNQTMFTLTAYAEDADPGPNNENRASTYVFVKVIDSNDETPEFVNRSKTVSVPEDVTKGTVLATFTAVDRDVNPAYGRFKYFISRKSDPHRQFSVNGNGQVSIQNQLDREDISQHFVHILAIDNYNDSPQNTGTATLIVTVTDINDNFPDFANLPEVVVKEEERHDNELVVTFSATDADEAKNGPPFSFTLNCNEEGASKKYCKSFSLTTNNAGDGGKGTGTVYVTTTKFDREIEKVVILPIRMCDLRGENRADQQCGYRYLPINIFDINDNEHNDATQHILVYNYKGLFKEFEIGTVYTNDRDDGKYDDKTFTLLNIDVAKFFVAVNENDGIITLQKNVPEVSFVIKVAVFDTVRQLRKVTTVTIEVVYITEDAVYNSGSVRIKGITPVDFIYKDSSDESSMYEKFRKELSQQLYGNASPAKQDQIQVLSVMQAGESTDVLFAAHGSPWYTSSRMAGIVSENKAEFEKVLTAKGVANNGTIDMVPVDMCQFENCEGGCFNKLTVDENKPSLVSAQSTSFVGVKTEIVGTCGCRATDFTAPIACQPGYCYHGGKCVMDDWGVVSCQCPVGFGGARCQQLVQSFDGTGYALYKPLEQCEQSRTSIEFLTKKLTAVILYNGPTEELSQSAPRDFILLELFDGYPRVRVDHGTGEVSLAITGDNKKRLNDGAWHTIDIFRDKKKVTLVVDYCVDTTFKNGTEDRSSCEAFGYTQGENIYVNVGQVLQLGGRMTNPTYPANVLTGKFDGCMKKLTHNTQVYDLSTGGQFPGAKDGCPREEDACGDAGCGHGQCLITGVTTSGAVKAVCQCETGYRTSTSNKCDTNTTLAHLGTKSFMDWKLKNTFKMALDEKKLAISFNFRTRDTDGVILSLSDKDNSNKYITFKIVGKQLQISYNMGSEAYDIVLSHIEISDGQWHNVTLERFGKEFILKIDSGEGRYYANSLGPINGAVDFNVREDQIYAGGIVDYSTTPLEVSSDDLTNSCLNDVRFDNGWFPMNMTENSQSPAADIVTMRNVSSNCVPNDCSNKCFKPFVCLPLWYSYECVCPEHHIKSGATCVKIDYCADSPCFGDAVCFSKPEPGKDETPFNCTCPPGKGWYGPLCQCHKSLTTKGGVCDLPDEEPVVAMASGIIIGVVLGILFLIAAIIILIGWIMWRRRPTKEELLDEDPDDDIRENIMYYDEEGAGEEDQTRYDLSRLRKPDDREHPTTWDAPDIPKSTKPLGAVSDRPDIGDFINGRLGDADDDLGSPPYDTPHDFNYEGGSSDAGSLSSLNTSSSGDQDYDYLSEWGPKFAKLADMYNNYDDAEL